MRSLYKKFENAVNNAPQRLHNAKISYGEKGAIKRKKPLYSSVAWTKEQEDKFNRFWINNYGKKINPAWHKLYQSINGVFDERYFPELFYSTKIEPMLNPKNYCDVVDDKRVLPYLFGNNDSIVYIPKIYLSCTGDIYKNSNNELMTREQAELFLKDFGVCVIKPATESGSGSGVYVVELNNGIDIKSQKPIKEIFDELEGNFIVQELIKNNENISKLCPNSLNTIRLITYYVGTEIHFAPPALRIGSGEKAVDNIHAGGLCVGVNLDGTLKAKAYKLEMGDNNLTFETHPKTNIKFENYYIGDIKRAIDGVIGLHKIIPQLGIVSWDITIDDKERPVLIEANCRNQSIWFPQFVNGEPVFGEDTEYFCKLISKT